MIQMKLNKVTENIFKSDYKSSHFSNLHFLVNTSGDTSVGEAMPENSGMEFEISSVPEDSATSTYL